MKYFTIGILSILIMIACANHSTTSTFPWIPPTPQVDAGAHDASIDALPDVLDQ